VIVDRPASRHRNPTRLGSPEGGYRPTMECPARGHGSPLPSRMPNRVGVRSEGQALAPAGVDRSKRLAAGKEKPPGGMAIGPTRVLDRARPAGPPATAGSRLLRHPPRVPRYFPALAGISLASGFCFWNPLTLSWAASFARKSMSLTSHRSPDLTSAKTMQPLS